MVESVQGNLSLWDPELKNMLLLDEEMALKAWIDGVEKYNKEYKADPLLMEDTLIGSEIFDPNQKFIYVYDFHKNWTFLVELINVNKEENPKLVYPSCSRTEGIAPSQYGTKGLINEKLSEIEEKYDLNTSILADGYSEEGESEDGNENEEEEVDDSATEEL